MSKKQKIIVSITGITLVLLILVGLTYAYFLTQIQGNTNNKSISVTTADLSLVYADGNGLISAELIQPGTTLTTKTFTVTNTGNATIEYGVFLEELINSFERTSDLELTVTCESSVTTPSVKTCSGYTGSMLTENDMLLSNSIDEGEIQTYSLTLEYVEAGVDQSVDMNKELSAIIQIYDLIGTVDLTGIISDAQDGDYVVVESTPKTSQIKSNGSFKVVGLTPGLHKVNVYNRNKTERYEKTLTIQKGSAETISGTTATVIDTTRTVVTTVASNGLTITNVITPSVITNPFASSTLAYQILENAINVTNAEKALHYAEYSPDPITTPAEEYSGENESTLSITEDDDGDSYYFRGNVENNYLDFAGYCWRIVRIQGDGSVKLVLASRNGVCENNSSFIKNSYTTVYNRIGTATTETLDMSQLNTFLNGGQSTYYDYNGSSCGSAGECWFYVTYPGFASADKEKIKSEQPCLENTNVKYNSDGTNYTSGSVWYYDNYKRLAISGMYNPTLVCNGTKGTSTKVSMITADEVAFSGNKSDANVGFYTHNNTSYITNINPYANTLNFCGKGIYYDFSLNKFRLFDSQTIDILPAISLVSNIGITGGNGSKTNPYIVESTAVASYTETYEVDD